MKINKALAKFLVAGKRPKKTMNYACLNGFLFAVNSAPEFIDSNLWLPMIYNHQDAKYKNAEQEKLIVSHLQALNDEINAQVVAEEFGLPDFLAPSPRIKENFYADAGIAHWGRGFLLGDDWLENLWLAYLPEEMQAERKSCIDTLGYFADLQKAKTFCKSADNIEPLSLEAVAETMLANFDVAAQCYAFMGRKLRQALDEQHAVSRTQQRN